ncbi:MAG TPA: TetR/AcrR family transcriptional regulator [Solirubrobacteraceae bacterium]|jgi:AcrR family transcriptional regulator|nr:TetR/AcrR family transcriptional regulator [Solirubrobacteraceae bacterium]
MTSTAARRAADKTALRKGVKGTQRERLVQGMVTAANRAGYARANVSAVIAEAKVSRPTFYDYFADRDQCFGAAIEHAHATLSGYVRAKIDAAPAEHALQASIRGLVQFASREPSLARFLTTEPMAGGPAALDARDAGITAIERMIQGRYRAADRGALAPDFSSRLIIGGICRVLAPRLRRLEPDTHTPALLEDLIAWVEAYEQPLARHSWRGLKPAPKTSRSPFVLDVPLAPPEPLPRGRLRLSELEVAENQRRRIMFAAALLAERKGYNATTIADITRQAGVDGRVFYSKFNDKQDAFMAVHELGFQHVMQVTAEAFFSAGSWPERNWEAGRAFTQFLEINPLVASVGFIEAYAVGPGAVQRFEDSHLAFSMLLKDGYRHLAQDRRPSQIALETIVATIFEAVYLGVRAGGAEQLSGLLPHFTFLVLSPFVGPEAANSFIEEKLAAEPT